MFYKDLMEKKKTQKYPHTYTNTRAKKNNTRNIYCICIGRCENFERHFTGMDRGKQLNKVHELVNILSIYFDTQHTYYTSRMGAIWIIMDSVWIEDYFN